MIETGGATVESKKTEESGNMTESRATEKIGKRAEGQKTADDRTMEENGMQKESSETREIAAFPADNRGIGVVEIILILVILIGLVLLFQTQIKGIVTNALNDISKGAGKIGI